MGTKNIINSVVNQLELGSIEEELEKTKIELEILEKQKREDMEAVLEAENNFELIEQRFLAKKNSLSKIAEERTNENKEISNNALVECQVEMANASKVYASVKDNPFRTQKVKKAAKETLIEKTNAYNFKVQSNNALFNTINNENELFKNAKSKEDLSGIFVLFTADELNPLTELMTQVANATADVDKQKKVLENTNSKINELKLKIEELNKKIEETKEERKVYQEKVKNAKNATAKKAASVIFAASAGVGAAIVKGKELYSKTKGAVEEEKETSSMQKEVEDENYEQPFVIEEIQQKTDDEKDSQVSDVAEKIINGASKGASVVLEKGKGLFNAAKADFNDALDYLEEALDEPEDENPYYVDSDSEERFKNTTSYLKEEGRKLVDGAKGFLKKYK